MIIGCLARCRGRMSPNELTQNTKSRELFTIDVVVITVVVVDVDDDVEENNNNTDIDDDFNDLIVNLFTSDINCLSIYHPELPMISPPGLYQ